MGYNASFTGGVSYYIIQKLIKILIACLLLLSFLTPTYASAPPPKVFYWDNFLVARPSITFNTNRATVGLKTPYSPIPMVLDMIEDAGFDPKVANAVITCESNWNSTAKGDSGRSWGLWQINQPSHPIGSKAFDPYESTLYAIELLKKNGWASWSCWYLIQGKQVPWLK